MRKGTGNVDTVHCTLSLASLSLSLVSRGLQLLCPPTHAMQKLEFRFTGTFIIHKKMVQKLFPSVVYK